MERNLIVENEMEKVLDLFCGEGLDSIKKEDFENVLISLGLYCS